MALTLSLLAERSRTHAAVPRDSLVRSAPLRHIQNQNQFKKGEDSNRSNSHKASGGIAAPAAAAAAPAAAAEVARTRTEHLQSITEKGFCFVHHGRQNACRPLFSGRVELRRVVESVVDTEGVARSGGSNSSRPYYLRLGGVFEGNTGDEEGVAETKGV